MSKSRFHRRATDDGEVLRIESICLKCGTIKVGSVLNGLPDWEQQHETECSKRRNRASYGLQRLRSKPRAA
jgi:hypothetical protein